MKRLQQMAPVLALALMGSGCGLVSTDFEGSVKILVEFFEAEDNSYSNIDRVDPNENADYRDNKDRIEEGELIGIDVTFVQLHPANQATTAVGQIDMKGADEADSDYVTAVGEWNGVNISQGASFPVALSPGAKTRVDELLFGDNAGPVDLRIVGTTDTATIGFTAEIEVRLKFTAGI